MSSIKLFLSVIVIQLIVANSYPAVPNILSCDEDQWRDTKDLIESRGYITETHRVHTKDGFILTVFRLRDSCALIEHPRPVILQHGLLDTSRSWLVASPGGFADEAVTATENNVGNTLGFELGKRCFDVWLPNSRGNKYSTEHERFSNNSLEFWDFTYDDMIMYDLPATIDYILDHTGHKNLDYVGHSQGTLIMFGLLSTQPKYQEKVSKFIALAPVARVSHIYTPFRHLSKFYPLFSWMNGMKGPFLLSTTAKSQDNLNISRIGVYSAEYPGGTSFKNMVHWLQAIRSGEFQKFDYGTRGNRINYGTSTPPKYYLSEISQTKIYLFSARNDWLAPPEDVDFIRQSLGAPPKLDYVVPNNQFNHNDFLFSLFTGELVNQKVYDILSDKL